jgi:hypothetical protein
MRAILCLVALSLVLSSCGEPRRLTYTFSKPNMTEQALLDDKQQLKGTKGVLDVMGKIDDMNRVFLEVTLDGDKEEAGTRYLLDHGYSKVRN